MYDRALRLGLPWRALWYQFGPFEAYFHTGDYQNVIALADNTLATTDYVEELFYWKGMALAAQGDAEAAAEQFARVLELNPNFFTAQTEYFRLESASFNLPPQMINLMEVMEELPRTPDATALPPTVVPPDSLSATLDYTATAIIETATAMSAVTATPIIVVPVVSPTPTAAD